MFDLEDWRGRYPVNKISGRFAYHLIDPTEMAEHAVVREYQRHLTHRPPYCELHSRNGSGIFHFGKISSRLRKFWNFCRVAAYT